MMPYDEKDVIDPKVFLAKSRQIDAAVQHQEASSTQPERVVLTDIQINFTRTVWLMLELMLASVPAVIAFMIIMFFVVNILSIGGLVALMAAFGGR